MQSSGGYPPLSDGSNSPEYGKLLGAKLRLPKARSLLRLGSLMERRKLPQRGLEYKGRQSRRSLHWSFQESGVYFISIAVWTSTRGREVRPMWTQVDRGMEGKNLIFCGRRKH